MTDLPYFAYLREHPSVILTSAILLIAVSVFLPSIVNAGTGGVPGGCAFVQTVNGATVYKACVGTNLPMWYSSSNPTYAEGDFPCGTFGNQNCGVEPGDPLNE